MREARTLAHVSARLAHVPHHPRLSVARYRHARREAACGAWEAACELAAQAHASLRVSHGEEHEATLEVAWWAEDLRVMAELEADLADDGKRDPQCLARYGKPNAQRIFRTPGAGDVLAHSLSGGIDGAPKVLEEPPLGNEPLDSFTGD